MAVLTTAFNTDFTPAVGDFNVQVSGGNAVLVRKNNSGASFAIVAPDMQGAFVVSNPIAGAVFQFRFSGTSSATVAVSADQ